MAVVGAVLDNAALLGAAFVLLLYQTNPFVRLSQPDSGGRFARFPQGAIQGWLIAAVSVGTVAGSALGGLLADTLGFNSIVWMATIAAAGSVALMVFVLRPAHRRLGGQPATSAEHLDELEAPP